MSKIHVNPGQDEMNGVISQIEADAAVDDLQLTIAGTSTGQIVIEGSKSEIANLICSAAFRDRFFDGASIKEVKAKIVG